MSYPAPLPFRRWKRLPVLLLLAAALPASAARVGEKEEVPSSILRGHTGILHAVAFSPDGKVLASGSADRTAKLWDAFTQKELATLKAHTDAVRAVAFSPDGKLLVTGGGDRTVIVWDAVRQM